MVKLFDSSEDKMNHTKITVKEEDLIKLVLEFLRGRNFNVTMRTLEKESGVVNCEYTNEILFLRELILDGDWEEVLLFAKPFEGVKGFEGDKFRYVIYKQKFLEMLSFKSHIVGKQMTESIEEVIKTLGCLEKCCPTKEDYSNLCWLLTVPDLSERIEFKNWSLDNSRMSCFDKIVEMLRKVLPMRRSFKRTKPLASRDRLLQLIIKGLFYESCVDYCQAVAVGSTETLGDELFIKNDLITGIPNDYSANLISWIKSLNSNTFGIPFEQISVEIALEKHRRPTHMTQSLDIPKVSHKKDIDIETIFKSLVGVGSSNGPIHAAGTDLRPGNVSMKPRGQPTEFSGHSIKLPVPITPSPRALSNSHLFNQQEKAEDLMASTNSELFMQRHGSLSSQENKVYKIHKDQRNTETGMIDRACKESGFDHGSHLLQYQSINPGDGEVTVKDLVEKQRLDVARQMERHERERKLIEKELQEANKMGATASDEREKTVNRQSVETDDITHGTIVPQDDKRQFSSTPPGQVEPQTKEFDYYDSLKRPNKTEKQRRHSDTVTHPALMQTSKVAKMSPQVTSTPKHSARNVKETPPPEVSPVSRHASYGPAMKEQRSKRAISREASQEGKKIESKEVLHVEEGSMQTSTLTESGKENAPSVVAPATSEPDTGARKGPMINGVRRTLAANPNPPASVQNAQKTTVVEDTRLEITGAEISAEGEKSVLGNNSSPKSSNEKPNSARTKSNEPPARNIKGSGPTIRVRDGTKVSVTELLRSKDVEVKNGTVTATNLALVEDIAAQVEEEPPPVEIREERLLSFNPLCKLEDMQAVRAVSFHPKGNMFAVGANSKTLRVCSALDDDFAECERGGLPTPVVLFKRTKYHRGSIYCVSWNPEGDVIATGSNDKTIKVMRFNVDNCIQEGVETDLAIHSGTVRELAFVPTKAATLISGGAGDGTILITDCQTEQTIGNLQGHSGTVMAVYAGQGDLVATGATDNTLRLWDLRSQRCIDVVMVGESSPATVALSPDGAYMATGQEDGCILLYDIAAGRTLQSFRLHQEDCRSVRFSPDSKYLLTGSYDTSIELIHVDRSHERSFSQHYVVGSHKDKVIQCRWHPWQHTFLSSSADRSVILWREQGI